MHSYARTHPTTEGYDVCGSCKKLDSCKPRAVQLGAGSWTDINYIQNSCITVRFDSWKNLEKLVNFGNWQLEQTFG